MKKILLSFFVIFIASFVLVSCTSDENDYEKISKKENLVRFKVTCNNPIAHFKIWDGGDTPEVGIGSWETSFSTKSYAVLLRVICKEDKKATIRIQMYVNNKLVRDESGYSWVEIHHKLK